MLITPRNAKLGICLSILFNLGTGIAAHSQLLERSNTNWGTSRVFSYAVTTTYGTSTSIDASPNVIAKAEAILNLKEDSVVTNKAGAIGGETSAVIVTSPNGTTANLSGISANADFIIDNGTSFYTSAETGEQDGEAQRAVVSATASHSLTISITNNENSFYNTLRENFEGAP